MTIEVLQSHQQKQQYFKSISEFSKKFEEFKKISPTIALIGTHKGMSKEEFDKKFTRISKSLAQMLQVFSSSSSTLTIISNYNKIFFPVSILNGDSDDVALI